ncbi:unnamed protein product [Nippostrongylus brasiliensis]|uniref:Apple domain-containing protein n=1 Tax=Nippostrongylus brasiliensis TaxID=27835 RepID=A0A0N4XKY6_NIPBR|nr:unnamed protein product [Nippostrongylus brasiliensis]
MAERPPQFQAKFEIEFPVDSVELCATRCYQDGCSGAKYDPKAATCALSYDDKHHCNNSGVVLHYDAREVTWIHCINCYTIKPKPGKGDGTVIEDQTTTAATTELATESTATTKNTEEQPFGHGTTRPLINNTDLTDEQLQGLLGKERPPHFTAAFEITFSTETVEICAYRCYQDGCTGARYLPDSKQCSLSYNDRAFCSPEKLVQIARPQQPVFIHCLSCESGANKSAGSQRRRTSGGQQCSKGRGQYRPGGEYCTSYHIFTRLF